MPIQIDMDELNRFWVRERDRHVQNFNVDADVKPLKIKKIEQQFPELKVLPNKDRDFQGIFKLPYETEEEILLRLKNSVIIINNNPFHVYNVLKHKEKERHLQVFNHKSEWYFVNFDDPNLDLRCNPPSYVYDRGDLRVYYMNRHAEQGLYRQGHVCENTYLYRLGQNTSRLPDSREHLLNLLLPSEDKKYTEDMEGQKGLLGIRLTKDIAIYSKRSTHIEYKGRYLAELKKGRLHLRKEDIKPWIIEKLQEANIPL